MLPFTLVVTSLAAASLAALAYHYVGYPMALWIAGRFARPRPSPSPIDPPPTISVIVPCYNEENHVAAKVADVLASDYPRDALEVIVVSDGSDDATGAVAASAGARVISWPERRGKPAALNAGVDAAHGEILVFSDANARLTPASLPALVAPFADRDVGAAAGEQVIAAGGRGESMYWRYEGAVKRLEAAVGSVVGADGSLYAVRRALYRRVPEGRLIMDDFFVSLSVVAAGARLVYVPAAVAYEDALASDSREFARKARIMAGSLVATAALDAAVWRRIPFAFFSHKVLRWLGPVFILVALAGAAAGAMGGSLGGYAMSAGGAVFVTLVGLGALTGRDRAPQPFRAAWAFAAANAALAWGWWLYLFGANAPAWRKLR